MTLIFTTSNFFFVLYDFLSALSECCTALQLELLSHVPLLAAADGGVAPATQGPEGGEGPAPCRDRPIVSPLDGRCALAPAALEEEAGHVGVSKQ